MSTASYDENTDKILRQVEFYFSDSNLPKDDFLRKLVEKSKDGLVNLNVVCSFSRMRSYLGLGNLKAGDVPDRIVHGVAEILRKSDVLEVSEDGKKIGRLRKLANPEEVLQQVDNRTVAASPLPYDIKIEDVQAFFGQFAKVNSVRLPRHSLDRNCFSGTALIEFSSEEQARDILKLKALYYGIIVELKPKKEFDADTKKSSIQSDKSSSSSKEKKISINNLSYEKGLVVSFTLMERVSGGPEGKISSPLLASDGLVQSQPNCNGNSTVSMKVSEGIAEDDGLAAMKSKKKKKRKKDNDGKAEEEILENSKKIKDSTKYVSEESVCKIAIGSNADAQQNNSAALFKGKGRVGVQDLEDVFARFGTIKHLQFDEKMDGYVCFKESDSALKARAAADLLGESGIVVKNRVAFFEALTGEAEKEYWDLRVAEG